LERNREVISNLDRIFLDRIFLDQVLILPT
jgi:hypothetical protein